MSLFLAACGTNDQGNESENANQAEETEPEQEQNSGGHGGHDMNHSGSGEIPEGLKEAENPKFEVGSKATITDAHMEGINHKWVTESELSQE
ncbi:hypothetical protein [Mesobacillus campisalis]|uniref:hypothetical protein n=1 Tax=Mesobacillus campisalis TaxID=1408103 RepID=UPI00069C4B0A|nr:hypothetical protein [Mesobacillus campisalis]